jgi:Spo0E like sporulation regulatory protein
MINKKREKLIDFGISLHNLTDSRLIKMSQELDVMIVEYQRVLFRIKK